MVKLLWSIVLCWCVVAWGKAHTPHTKQVTLKALEWSDNPSFTYDLLSKAEPVLLLNSPAHSWDAIKWTPEYVSKQSKTTLGVKKHTDPKFPVGCCPLIPMTMAQFWDAAKNPAKGTYMYLNAQSHLVDKSLINQIGPKHFIEFPEGSEEERMMNVWMGTKGTTAPLHYDPFENFFVQIYGRKRFYLFPPQQFHNVYLYPKTHAKYRQVQANINSDKVYDLYPNLQIAEGIEVELGPGDVMYLPPFWFHQVESLSAAISVNTWYYNPFVQSMDAAWEIPLPLSAEFSEDKIGPIMQYFITRVIEGVYGKASVTSFFNTLVATKYTPLYGHLESVDLFAHVGSMDDPHLRVHLREQAKVDASTFLSHPDEQTDIYCSLTPEETREVIRSDKAVTSTFKKSVAHLVETFKSAPAHLRDMHIEDYIEDLVGQTVGDKNTYTFLKKCFATTGPSNT